MKKIFFIAIPFFLLIHSLFGQGKEGFIWVLGYPSDPGLPSSLQGGTLINFDNGLPDTSRFMLGIEMSLSSSITDADSKLLFYTNGCEIYNRNHLITQNGNNLNAGEARDYSCIDPLKLYNIYQGIVALPWPKHESFYQIIHIRQIKPFIINNEICITTIDGRLDNGLGGVIEKNTVIFDKGISQWFMTATRHGNGLDWWISVPEWRSRRYFVYLLDSLGMHGPDIQENAGLFTETGAAGQCAFSPDGTKYAEVSLTHGQVLDFNRCTGKFSNPRIIQFDLSGLTMCAGVAFSPDSRYLYVSRGDILFQYDMTAADFNGTRLTVAQFDGVFDPTGLKSPFFYTMLPAPDGKIYMNANTSTKALHIIHRPNERGTDCDFQKWGLELPTLHFGQLPNLPNFRLGAVDPPCGSGNCDTLPATEVFTVFPNPARDYVVISNKHASNSAPFTFQLYDALGRLVVEEHPDCLPHRVELTDLPDAGYFYRVFNAAGGKVGSGTLVKG
jgi:hypothetical protein